VSISEIGAIDATRCGVNVTEMEGIGPWRGARDGYAYGFALSLY